MFRFSSRTRGGTVSRRRHSLNMTSLPTRPLPSLNGWTRSNIQWHIAMRTGSSDRPAYAAYTRSIIPGTSRSGSTIIGGMLCGCSRTAAAEFTFFLAIPVMFGWGVLKLIKYLMAVGLAMTATEIAVLVVGIVTAFVVSVISIKFLTGYIKKNDFTAFGVYRIIVGLVVLAYFGVKVLL